jgi:hypothetical protein
MGHSARRIRRPLLVAAAILGAVCVLPGVASARTPKLLEDRSFGVGTAIGGGYVLATADPTSWDVLTAKGTPSLLLPSLELRFFFAGERSLDLSVPVVNSLVIGMADHLFATSVEAYYNFNFELGSERTRLLLGGGLGLSLAVGGGSSGTGAAALRIPVIVGVEFMSLERDFGFQIRAHPWVEFAGGKVASIATNSVGAGVMAEIAILGYGLAPR